MDKNATMQTADPELMRAINRFHVLDTLRRFEPISRVEIGARTRLARATVSAIVSDLIAEGLVREGLADEVAEGNGPAAGRGRPRIMLRMNPQAAHVVGIKLSLHQIAILVTNLKAEVLLSLVLPVRTERMAPEVIADLLEDGVRNSVAKAGLRLGDILGIGIGVPGFIDHGAGVVTWSPIFGRAMPAFARMVGDRLGVPTIMENDVNLVTLAERWFGQGQDIDDFMVVTVEHGVGMGLFLNGELYRGHHGLGAEFGHVKLGLDGPRCRCGQAGCIEAHAADYAILREAARIIELPDVTDAFAAHQAIAEVTRLALEGDERLAALFTRAGAALGLGIANLCNVLNPARVIVSGAGTRAGSLLLDPLKATMEANLISALQGRIDVLVEPWGDDVWARGAASLVLEGIYRAPWSRVDRPRALIGA